MNRKQEKAAKKTFCLPRKMKRQLAEYSKETSTSEAELLRQMIREFFERRTPQDQWKEKVDAYYEHLELEGES